jgi:GNAT superfamily N-acetyltransferase
MEPASIDVRPATMDDSSVIADLVNELGAPTPIKDVDGRLESTLTAPDHAVLIAATPDGFPVGWIHVFVALRLQTASFAELGGVVVTQTYRRKGVGRLLLEAAETWAADNGVLKMRIRSRDTRSEAKSFYISQGYGHSKTQRVFDKILSYQTRT